MINPAQKVNDFHKNDDIDVARSSHHHSLGEGTTQAYPGSEGKANAEAITTLNTDVTDLTNRVVTLETPSFCHRYRTTTQNVNTSTLTTINFNTSNPRNTPDLVWDTTHLGIRNDGEPGFFEVMVTFNWTVFATTGRINGELKKREADGTVVFIDTDGKTGNGSNTGRISNRLYSVDWLNTGDLFYAFAYQNSGSSVNLDPSGLGSGGVYMKVVRRF